MIDVNYKPLSESTMLLNPERGFYIHTQVYSTGVYEALNQDDLNRIRSMSLTILLRIFYLENFITTQISSAFLSNIESDLNKIRIAGLKCILRFVYSDDPNKLGSLDANKTQILAHIDQLKPILTTNIDVIFVVQAGFIGTWGTWYYTDHFGYPSPDSNDNMNRRYVLDALLAALPSSRMVQLRTPSLKQTLYSSTTPISEAEAYGTNASRIGFHNDCFLASEDDFGTYTNIEEEYPYLEQETKYVPMGGETCAVNEPRSLCPTALTELEKFHWSYLNDNSESAVIRRFKEDGCYQTIFNRLGYRYEMVNGTYPESASIRSEFNITFNVFNRGFASAINQRTAYLIFKNLNSDEVVSVPLKTDIRFWTSGSLTKVSESILLPSSTVPGSYQLYLHLPDPILSNREDYSIAVANERTWEISTGYNSLLHSINLN